MHRLDKYKKRVRDPIYGYVGLTQEQLEVIKLPAFQRLRRISQLSYGDMAYPNATHNRFAHSLGTMHLAGIAAGYLKRSGIGEDLELGDDDYEAIEWAGLLHDIGHLPFSHVSEPAFAHFIGARDDWRGYHEETGQKIMREPAFGIVEVLGPDMLNRVLDLIVDNESEQRNLLKEVLAGACGIDRLDCLRRDAHHAGTPEYAIIDYDRILASIMYYAGDPYISPVFHEKSLYVLEGAILSYFYMYRAIYYHHTVRAACLLLRDILWEAFEQHGLAEDLKGAFSPGFWEHLDDYRLTSILRSKENLRPRLDALLFRDLPKRVRELSDENIRRIARFVEQNKYNESGLRKEQTAIAEELRKRYAEIELLLLDSPVVTPYPRSAFSARVVYTWDGKSSSEPTPIAEKAPYLPRLLDASEQQFGARVYVCPGDLAKNAKFIEDLNSVIMEIFH